jgi:hypothetical protein
MRWRRFAAVWLVALAAMVLAVSQLDAGASAPTRPTAKAKHDYRDMVDFTGRPGLDPFNPADSALLGMLEPDRIKDPALRADMKSQVAWLAQRQKAAEGLALKTGKSKQEARKYALAASVSMTIDPGCQLTSSTPDGYDLCGYYSAGDTMSIWSCSPNNRKQVMWAGVQESDALYGGGPNQSWRAWAKSQTTGCQGTVVNSWVDLKQFEAWACDMVPEGDCTFDKTLLGVSDPANHTTDGGTKYWTGVMREQNVCTTTGGGCDNDFAPGVFYVRDGVSILDGNGNVVASSSTDNNNASWWWNRTFSQIYCPGPRSWGNGC